MLLAFWQWGNGPSKNAHPTLHIHVPLLGMKPLQPAPWGLGGRVSEMLAGHFSHPPTAEAMYAYIDINMTSITQVSCLTGFQNFLLKMDCKCLQRFFKQALTSGKRVCYANRKGNFSPSLQTSKLHHKKGFGISWKDRNIISDEFFHLS